eukprot:COSAG01_NODE_4603_length_4884_cov_31.141902_6_plen_162_part_01
MTGWTSGFGDGCIARVLDVAPNRRLSSCLLVVGAPIAGIVDREEFLRWYEQHSALQEAAQGAGYDLDDRDDHNLMALLMVSRAADAFDSIHPVTATRRRRARNSPLRCRVATNPFVALLLSLSLSLSPLFMASRPSLCDKGDIQWPYPCVSQGVFGTCPTLS